MGVGFTEITQFQLQPFQVLLLKQSLVQWQPNRLKSIQAMRSPTIPSISYVQSEKGHLHFGMVQSICFLAGTEMAVKDLFSSSSVRINEPEIFGINY